MGAALGGAAWVVLAAFAAAGVGPLGIIELYAVLGPLVVVPLGLDVLLRGEPELAGRKLLTWARPMLLPAALLATASFYLPVGPAAGALAAAWCAPAALIVAAGIQHGCRCGLRLLSETSVAAGLGFLAIGAAFLPISRLGLTPGGFQEPIVLLTAVHFHFTGFAAPILAGLAGRGLQPDQGVMRCVWRLAAVGAIVAPPVLAIGFNVSPILKITAALLQAASLVLLGAVQMEIAMATFPGFMRGLLWISSLSVWLGMGLAAMYAVEEYECTNVFRLTIPAMAQVHGSANALGFALAGLLAWRIGRPRT